ncbi:MAG: Basic amino-acid permease [Alyxoria varia]|nr:MAG: Basic amino-acid permease [Alyxoria varia]
MATHSRGFFFALSIISFLCLLSTRIAQNPTRASAHVVEARWAGSSLNATQEPGDQATISSIERQSIEDPEISATAGSEPLQIANEFIMDNSDVITRGRYSVLLHQPESYPTLPLTKETKEAWIEVDYEKLLSDHFADAEVSDEELGNMRKLPMNPGYVANIKNETLTKILGNTKYVEMVEVMFDLPEENPIETRTSPAAENQKRAVESDSMTKDEVEYNLRMISEPDMVKYAKELPEFQKTTGDDGKSVRAKDAGKDVKAYIVDFGIMVHHPEFSGDYQGDRMEIGSRVTPPPRGTGIDVQHGTHVAGIVGGRTVGVAPKVKLVDSPVYPIGNVRSYESLQRTLDLIKSDVFEPWQKGAVIACALSFYVHRKSDPMPSLKGQLNDLLRMGIWFVNSAGNSGKQLSTEEKVWPCDYDNVICVGSIGPGYKKSVFSNYGAGVDIWAPGEDIKSARVFFGKNDGKQPYRSASGTSYAAPHVAGIIAAILGDDSWQAKIKGRGPKIAAYARKILYANAQVKEIEGVGLAYVANNGFNNPLRGERAFYVPENLETFEYNMPPKPGVDDMPYKPVVDEDQPAQRQPLQLTRQLAISRDPKGQNKPSQLTRQLPLALDPERLRQLSEFYPRAKLTIHRQGPRTEDRS